MLAVIVMVVTAAVPPLMAQDTTAHKDSSGHSDSIPRRRAARRLGGLCGTAHTFIVSGRPKMKPTAYADSLRILAKQLVTRLDSLSNALPPCEKTAGHDPATVVTDLTKRLTAYDDALLAFRNGQAALNRSDSSKTVSQQ